MTMLATHPAGPTTARFDVAALIARLFPPPPMPFESLAATELRLLRESLAGPPPEPPKLFMTRNTGHALAKSHNPAHDSTVGGSWEAGRKYLPEIIGRFDRGDLGAGGMGEGVGVYPLTVEIRGYDRPLAVLIVAREDGPSPRTLVLTLDELEN